MENKYTECIVNATSSVMESFGLSVDVGDAILKVSPFQADSIIVVIGLTGDLHGQAIISMKQETACHIASVMMGGAPAELNEVTRSAVGELANMIIGNSVTLLSQVGVMLDITPPSVLTGQYIHVTTVSRSICLPFRLDGERVMEFSISAKELSN